MLDNLKNNLNQQKKIVREIEEMDSKSKNTRDPNQQVYEKSSEALKGQLGILNNATPTLLQNIPDKKELDTYTPNPTTPVNVATINYVSPTTKQESAVTVNREDKKQFIGQVKTLDANIKSMKSIPGTNTGGEDWLARISNSLFLKIGDRLAPSLSDVGQDLRKANMTYSLPTYLAVAIFITLSVFLISLVGIMVFGILNPKLMIWIWVPFALLPILVVGSYVFPALRRGSVQGKISEELPFATIYMSAVASAGVEPTRIFRLVAQSDEYRNVGIEIKKMITLMDVFGYDLVTALKMFSQKTTNKKLSDLMDGLARNIMTGGSLNEYLEKKAETLLLDYKLERQKYSELAGTFMNLYISVLIAAPLILMILFVIMQATGLGSQSLMNMLTPLSLGGIAVANIVFLFILHMKQPQG